MKKSAIALSLGLAASVDAASFSVQELATIHSEVTGCILPAGLCYDGELGTMAPNLNSVELCATRPGTIWVAQIADAAALGRAAASQLAVVPSDQPQMFIGRLSPGSSVTAGRMNTLNGNVKVESYFRCPNEYLIMFGTEATVQAAMNQASLTFSPPKPLAVPDAWKISPDINLSINPDRESMNATEVFDVQIRIASGSDAPSIASKLKTALVDQRARRRRLQGDAIVGEIDVAETSTGLLTATGLELADELLHGEAMAELAAVSFISRKGVFSVDNFDASIYGQSGTSLGSSGQTVNTADNSPFYSVGIDGTGQVVSVGDSGLDYNHCMFKDDTVAVTPIQDEAVNPAGHRKVVQYFSYEDTKEGTRGGHGTHGKLVVVNCVTYVSMYIWLLHQHSMAQIYTFTKTTHSNHSPSVFNGLIIQYSVRICRRRCGKPDWTWCGIWC
jgi:hypothetical protein